MRRYAVVASGVVSIAVLGGGLAWLGARDSSPSAEEQWPLFGQYCIDCHNRDDQHRHCDRYPGHGPEERHDLLGFGTAGLEDRLRAGTSRKKCNAAGGKSDVCDRTLRHRVGSACAVASLDGNAISAAR